MEFLPKLLLPWFRKAALIGVIFLFALPGKAQAADTCTCFCGNNELGAVESVTYDSAADCAKSCRDAGTLYVGCFTNETYFPENSDLCWTEMECESHPIEVAGKTYYGSWTSQSPYCSKKPITGAEMGYCYGPLRPITLSVPIFGTTEIGDLGQYVNLLYTYAIPIAALIAVLLFMIAGFQYMTAGGDKKGVTQAKERMKNTVIGLILLLSVYAIANFLDPRLVRFTSLRPPLIKEAVLIDAQTTCEAMQEYGYTIQPTSGSCGNKGTIVDDDGVQGNIANPPDMGDTCTFSACSESGKACALNSDGSGGVCVACNQISSNSVTVSVTPSTATCKGIAKTADTNDRNDLHVYSCYYDDDLLGSDECVQLYTSGENYINCAELYGYMETTAWGEDGCDAYEKLNADSYGLNTDGTLSAMFMAGSADEIGDFEEVFQRLCEDDPCKMAEKSGQNSCVFQVTDSLTNSALSSLPGVTGMFASYVIDQNLNCIGQKTLDASGSE